MEEKNKGKVRVISGTWVDVLRPDPDTLLLSDICHGLSHLNRYIGHTDTPYSVGQHSILCAHLAAPAHKLAALLHDASEAYLNDIGKPVKDELSQYFKIEDNFMKILAAKFKFEYPLSNMVKCIDKLAYEYEWDALIEGNKPHELLEYVMTLSPERVRKEFKIMYNKLSKSK